MYQKERSHASTFFPFCFYLYPKSSSSFERVPIANSTAIATTKPKRMELHNADNELILF